MNITPALPRPHDLPVPQERKAVGALRPANPARVVTDEAEGRPPRAIDQAERERLAAQADAAVSRQAGLPPHASRALASYARVAEDGERSTLRELLGFDAYA